MKKRERQLREILDKTHSDRAEMHRFVDAIFDVRGEKGFSGSIHELTAVEVGEIHKIIFDTNK